MATLPHCDDLFTRYFDPWYTERERERKGFKATRPDLLQAKSLIGLSPADASPLSKEGQTEALRRIDGMVEAAREDWPTYLKISGDIDLHWIQAFDQYYDSDRIEMVITSSDAQDFGNDYVVLCCEFGAVLGLVMRSLKPRLIWHLNWPYWESALLDSRNGTVIPVFHWAIKKMSGYGCNDGFTKKLMACLEHLDSDGSDSEKVLRY